MSIAVAVLKKEKGLLPPGGVLSHVAVAQIPLYHKLLLFSDAAVIPTLFPYTSELQS